MAALTPVPKIQFFDANGHPLAGGKLYSYAAGTTTPLVTYTDQAGTSANTNPVILDARGEASVWLGTGPYKLRLTTSTDVDIWTVDDIYSEGALSMQELLSSSGSSLVGFIQSGTGAAYRTVQSKLRDTVSVKDFGAVGDGVADDTAAFIAAYTAHPGEAIRVPGPSVGYKITGLLTLPTNTIFVGDARHVTKILHAYNGDFANLGDGAGFVDCWIDGQGATYTGGCFVFSGTNGRQIRRGVRASDFDGAIESFEVSAGSQSLALDVRYSRRNAGTGTNRFAVVISPTQQLSAVPRKYVAVETEGTCAFDFGGCNNVYIAASFLGDLKYTADSRGVLISESRIANQAALTVDGHNNTITGCNITPQITVAANADAIVIQGCSFNNLPIIDNSANGRNLFDSWALIYTPALTSGGTPPSIGNGSIEGTFTRQGATTWINGELTLGSTTSLGTGGLKISLPQKRHSGDIFVGGTVVMNRGGTLYVGTLQIGGAVTEASLIRDTTGSVTFNSPGVFAAGDTIRWSAVYSN